MAAAVEVVRANLAGESNRAQSRSSRIGLWLTALAIAVGFAVPIEQYISPQFGLGYWLGIVGGSLMLVLVVYPMRKRMPSLAVLGSVQLWFQIHMVFGIIGPLAVLYHANFRLGATNSNVALICMLLVAGSGVVGRYLYARIHNGLYGKKTTVQELAADAEKLRKHSGALRLLPGLMLEVEQAERHIGRPAPLVIRPFLAALREQRATRRISRLVRNAVAMASTRSSTLSRERERFTQAATAYISARLKAARRVAEFQASERLFVVWHVLHMPLFVVLVIVGVVHVIAVHVY